MYKFFDKVVGETLMQECKAHLYQSKISSTTKSTIDVQKHRRKCSLYLWCSLPTYSCYIPHLILNRSHFKWFQVLVTLTQEENLCLYSLTSNLQCEFYTEGWELLPWNMTKENSWVLWAPSRISAHSWTWELIFCSPLCFNRWCTCCFIAV